MPCPSTGPKVFCAGLNILGLNCTPKNFEPAQMEIIFWSGTKSLGLEEFTFHFLVWQKTFAPAQNILEPIEGRVMRELREN